MSSETAITIGSSAAMAAAATALPTSLQIASALIGALIGLWAAAVDSWGDEPAVLWAVRLVGRVLLAAMVGVLGSTAIHVGGPSVWSYLHTVHPGTWLEDVGAGALGVSMLPVWTTAPTLAALSLWALPLLARRLQAIITGDRA